MVGILIVSHSKKVAEGIYELALQMTGEQHKMLAAGGMEDGSIGTDALRISQGIKQIMDDDGVVILADLGSAILSAQMAIELLEEELEQKIPVVIADAPILEGTIGAAVQASLGSTMEEVVREAESAREMRKVE